MSSSAETAITEYQRLGGLNNRNLFFTVLEAGKSQVKVLANSFSGEGPLPPLQMTALGRRGREKESACVCVVFVGASSLLSLLIRRLILSDQGPTQDVI